MTTTSADLPPPPPEAELIAARRKAARPRLSMRRAALAAGIAPTTWAEIENARKPVAAGIVVYRKGTPEMLAPMAAVLGITPAELRDRGRDDAAEELEAIAGQVEQVAVFTRSQANALAARVRRDSHGLAL